MKPPPSLSLFIFGLISLAGIGLYFVSTPDYTVAAFSRPVPLLFFALGFGTLYLFALPVYNYFLHLSESSRSSTSLKILISAGAGTAIVIFLFFSLLYSQDFYWHISYISAWIHEGLNPYATTITGMTENEWTIRVFSWRDITTHLGPLWSLFLTPFAWLSLSIGKTLIVVRLAFLGIIALSAWLFNLVMKNGGHELRRRSAFLFLFLSSPLIIIYGLIDLHSDILLVPLFLTAYYFIQKKNYALSASTLLLGASIKYVPGLLIFVPLILSLREAGFKRTLKTFIPVGMFGLILLGSSLFIFGKSILLPPGFAFYLTALNSLQSLGGAALITFVATSFFDAGILKFAVALKFIGALTIVLFSSFLAWRQLPLHAFVWPFLVTFFFFVPWFFPWYFLWVLPFFILLVPPRIVIYASSLLILIIGSGWGIIVSPLFVALLIPFLIRKLTTPSTEKTKTETHFGI